MTRSFVLVDAPAPVGKPVQRTQSEDELFAMKNSDVMAVMSLEDFWWYHLECVENGKAEFAVNVLKYRSEFLLHGRIFRGPAAQ